MLLKDHVFVKPPALLFKYAGTWVAKFFEDPCLHFSSPAVFNDPFDFFPTLNLKINRQLRLKLCRYNNLPKTLSTNDLSIKIAELMQEQVGKNYAVFCMSEEPDNILM